MILGHHDPLEGDAEYRRGDVLPGAVDLDIAPEALAPYLDYVRKPRNGYVSVEVPLGDRIELSMRG